MKKTLLIFLSGLLLFSFNSMAQNWLTAGNALSANGTLGSTTNFSVIFKTNNTERGRITNGGNWGIGTTNPLTKFHVNGFGSFGNSITSSNATRALNLVDANAVMRILRVSATAAPAVELLSRTSADGANVAYWDLYAQPTDASFRIRDRQSGSTTLDRITVLHTNGNVGIGTTSPQSKLDVAGGITAYNSYFIRAGGSPGVSVGRSGANYGSVGYGLTFTDTTDRYRYTISDFSSMLQFRTGGFDFNIAPVGTAGSIIPYITAMRIEQNGNVGIGTLTPANKLSVAGTGDFLHLKATGSSDFAQVNMSGFSVISSSLIAAQIENTSNLNSSHGLKITAGSNTGNGAYFTMFYRPDATFCGGIFQVGGNGVSYGSASDKRLKNIIGTTQKGLSDLMKIKIYDYTFKSDPQKMLLTGFMAQELYDVFPQSVRKPIDNNEPAEKNPWMVDYGSVTPLIIKSVQEQQTMIDEQKASNDELKKSNDELKKQNKNLEERILKLEAALQSLTGSNGNILNVVTNASLEQNTPNPFTKNTIIRYGIPQGSKGQINIYDNAGKLVKTLKANAGGLSQVSGQDLAAGAYTYTLMVDRKVALSKQMVIAK